MILEQTNWIGKEYYHFDTIDSTNKKAKELAAKGCANGTLVVADTQKAGIGRRGRNWSSEAKTGIYMSLVLRPQLEVQQAPQLTIITALAVVKAIESLLHEEGKHLETKHNPMIKWPNDIVINGRKICGILTEMTLDKEQIDSVVIGVGINVSNQDFPKDICAVASSILLETGINLRKERLIQKVWEYFEEYYEYLLKTGDLSRVKDEYQTFLVNKDRKVNVLDPKGAYTGIAKGITKTGELLVDTGDGVEIVSSGEVSVRGIYGYV